MLYEVNYRKNIIKNNFNKPLKMTDKDEENSRKPISATFVVKNILIKTFVSETIVISLVSTEVRLIKIATLISN